MTDQTFLPANADSLARLHTAEAVGALVDVMRNGKPAERLRAAEIVLDRGHGRAVQAVISVPARQAVALRLASMSDAELMQIAKSRGGSTPEKGSPHALGLRVGTIPEPDAYSQGSRVTEPGVGLVALLRGDRDSDEGDVTEAEFFDPEDPCG